MAELRSTGMAAKRATMQPPPGELLEDRIRDGIAGSLAEQIAIGLQVGRALQGWHGKKRFLEALSSATITIDAEDNVTLFGAENKDASYRCQNIHAFGVVLYELLTGKLMQDHEEEEPDLEMLHKAGLPPALVNVVSQCLTTPDEANVLEASTAKLKSMLRERLGEREPASKGLWVVIGVVILAVCGFLAWQFLG